MEDKDKEYIFRWGLSLQDLYSVALQFFKGNSFILLSALHSYVL